MAKTKERCAWAAKSDAQMQQYHDEEWGRPEKDSRALWELLMLEGFQAGLSWQVILRKREGFRHAFKGFDPRKVARFGERDVERLMQDQSIVRARAKIEATIAGAKIYLDMERHGEDFSKYLWGFSGGKVVRNADPQTVESELSGEISRDLRRRGFKFVGPVIVYAFLQAAGIVDDHQPDCFRHKSLKTK
jgi:DNA-3-methyladenine glycosylase I